MRRADHRPPYRHGLFELRARRNRFLEQPLIEIATHDGPAPEAPLVSGCDLYVRRAAHHHSLNRKAMLLDTRREIPPAQNPERTGIDAIAAQLVTGEAGTIQKKHAGAGSTQNRRSHRSRRTCARDQHIPHHVMLWHKVNCAIEGGLMSVWDVTNGFSASGMRGTFEPGATIGGARIQFAGALATYTAGRLTGRRRVASVGSDVIRAQILAQTMTAGIKLSARRHRPDGDEFSFPSGHTSVTFATATVLQRNFGWKAGIPAYALASYVAASRVQMKRHFLSDIAFGAGIGIVAGRTVTMGRGRTRFAVAPTISPNQAGVSLVLLDKR